MLVYDYETKCNLHTVLQSRPFTYTEIVRNEFSVIIVDLNCTESLT